MVLVCVSPALALLPPHCPTFLCRKTQGLSGPVGKLHNTRLRGSAMDASTFGKVMSSEDKYLVTVTLPQSAFEADISQAEDVSPCFIAKRPCGCSLIIHVVSEWESACLGDSDAKLPQWQMHCVRLRRKIPRWFAPISSPDQFSKLARAKLREATDKTDMVARPSRLHF